MAAIGAITKGPVSERKRINDTADRLANKFRLKGESSEPAPYFWETEEALLFQHGNVSVQGDPRSYLKRLEQDHMIKIWKQKAPKQASSAIKLFPSYEPPCHLTKPVYFFRQ